MANGDAADAAGMDVVPATADLRQGYDEINKTRDYLVTRVFSDSQIAGSVTAAGDTVVKRNGSGDFAVNPPTAGSHPASKNYADALGSQLADGDTIARRNPSGQLAVATPTLGAHATPKSYVDAAIAGIPTGSDLADGPTTAAYTRSATGSGFRSVWMNSSNQFMFNTSSRRYKHSIQPLDLEQALATVRALVAVSYKRRGRHTHDDVEHGLIAEDVAALVPTAVFTDDKGRPEGINYEMLIPELLAAVQALALRVEQLGGAADA